MTFLVEHDLTWQNLSLNGDNSGWQAMMINKNMIFYLILVESILKL